MEQEASVIGSARAVTTVTRYGGKSRMGGVTSDTRGSSKRVDTKTLLGWQRGDQHEWYKRKESDIPEPSKPLTKRSRGPVDHLSPFFLVLLSDLPSTWGYLLPGITTNPALYYSYRKCCNSHLGSNPCTKQVHGCEVGVPLRAFSTSLYPNQLCVGTGLKEGRCGD